MPTSSCILLVIQKWHVDDRLLTFRIYISAVHTPWAATSCYHLRSSSVTPWGAASFQHICSSIITPRVTASFQHFVSTVSRHEWLHTFTNLCFSDAYANVATSFQLFTFSSVYANEWLYVFGYLPSAMFTPTSGCMSSVIYFQQCSHRRADVCL